MWTQPSGVTETCACGATFRATGISAGAHADTWRRQHRCTLVRPGLCMNRSPALGGPGEQDGAYLCNLRHGHAGAHETKPDLSGTVIHWRNA